MLSLEKTTSSRQIILGVTLSMTREQAISYLQAKHGAGQPQQITHQVYVGADYTPPAVVAAYSLDITPTEEKYSESGSVSNPCMGEGPSATDLAGSDHFCIEVSPLDNDDILAIKRARVYPTAKQPLKTTFMQSVIGNMANPQIHLEGMDQCGAGMINDLRRSVKLGPITQVFSIATIPFLG